MFSKSAVPASFGPCEGIDGLQSLQTTGKASKLWYFVGWTRRYCWSPLFEITTCSFGGFWGFRTNNYCCTKCCQNIVLWNLKVSPYVAYRELSKSAGSCP